VNALLATMRMALLLALSAALHLAAARALLPPRPETPPIRIDLSRIDLRVVTRLPGTGSGNAPGPPGAGAGLPAPAPALPGPAPQAAVDAGIAALDAARDLLIDWSASAAGALEAPAKPVEAPVQKKNPSRKMKRGGSAPAPPPGPTAPDPHHLSRPSLSPLPRREGRAECESGGLEGRRPSSGLPGGAPGLSSSSSGPPGGGGLGPDLGGARGGGSDLGALARAITSAVRRRLVYPESARRGGARGRVTVAFMLDPSGAIGGARVVAGSRFPDLDDAVLAALRAASPIRLPFRPHAALELTLPVHFELHGRP
jgi:TonB family protein